MKTIPYFSSESPLENLWPSTLHKPSPNLLGSPLMKSKYFSHSDCLSLSPRQLGDVVGYFSCLHSLGLIVQNFYDVGEPTEIWDDQLMSQSPQSKL